jgi:hypothetical protein
VVSGETETEGGPDGVYSRYGKDALAGVAKNPNSTDPVLFQVVEHRMISARALAAVARNEKALDPTLAKVVEDSNVNAEALNSVAKNANVKDETRARSAALQLDLVKKAVSNCPGLPKPKSIEPWDGGNKVGMVLQVGDDDKCVVIHTGQGRFQMLNVKRDLRGVHPQINEMTSLTIDGLAIPRTQMGQATSR